MRAPLSALLGSALLLAACTKTPAPASTATTPPTSAASSAVRSKKATDTFPTSKGDVRVTPILHASVLLEVAGQAIYIDPLSKGDFVGLPKADFILLTDNHPDHLDAKELDALSTRATRIVAPPAVAGELAGRPKVIVLENGKKQGLGLFEVEVEAVPMYNLERGPELGKKYHEKGRGNGYILSFGNKRFYLSGDTECTPEVKALRSIDVAFLCMNLPYTMTPKEAGECVNAFKPKVLFPYHYGVPGGPMSNLDELDAALDPKAGVEVRRRAWY